MRELGGMNPKLRSSKARNPRLPSPQLRNLQFQNPKLPLNLRVPDMDMDMDAKDAKT